MATGNFGLSEHQLILEKLCRICGERLKKAKDKYENSFLCADKKEMIFTAFGVKIQEDDVETCPPPPLPSSATNVTSLLHEKVHV